MITTDLFKHKFIPAKKKSDFLMIVLHGRGDSIRPFYDFDDELNIPEMNYLLLNAPRRFLDGYTWYGEPPYQSNGVIKIREKLFDLLNDLENQGWDSQKIFLFGFSQGCLISADIGMNYPKKLGGVVGISGYFNFYPRWKNNLSQDAKKTPWLFTHGHQDDILPLEETKYGVEKLKGAGLKVDWVEMDKDHSLKDEEYPIIRRWVREKLSDLR
ncbi:MAG TPA: serine esterase [Bdellovibrio sp.]|uniref:alpha/beta hydrolase n=1 Tax=Bdellovibrio sp. TaxID=28201 RepID=UPI002EE36F02